MTTKKKITKKKTKKRVAGRAAPKKRLPVWSILLIGMLGGLAVAITAYVKGWVPKIESVQPEITINTGKESEIEDISEQVTIKPKQDYVFYETLQEMEVVVDDNELAVKIDETPTNYVLQIGAFKNLSDAEEMKAQVAFAGISTNIQETEIKGVKWHRVRTNPYAGARKADMVLKELKRNGFKAIVLEDSKPET
ncbi:MAG: SPOR domain-containing protein [Gammaproteobacteria bacterium]|jgi:cell division protein FtsN|nr:SPOR domain-containing protein [Xanthomonadales bacterium]